MRKRATSQHGPTISTRAFDDDPGQAPHGAPTAEFYVVLVNPPGPHQYKAIALGEGPQTIGRDHDCAVAFDSSDVSRRHAELVREGASWRLTDLKSTNGTHIEGTAITSAVLKSGDSFQVGSNELVLLDRAHPRLRTFFQYFVERRRDRLTNLPGPQAFREALEDWRDKGNGLLAVILLEIDDFQRINTELGAQLGDELLVTVATALRTTGSDGDLFRAMGGRFAAVVKGMPPQLAETYANELIESVRSAAGERSSTPLTLSAGIAGIQHSIGLDMNDVVAIAERALSRAARSGGGRTYSDAPLASLSSPELTFENTSPGILLGQTDRRYLRRSLRVFQQSLTAGNFVFAVELNDRQILAVTNHRLFTRLEAILDGVLREFVITSESEAAISVGEALGGNPLLVAVEGKAAEQADAIASEISEAFHERCRSSGIDGSLRVGSAIRVGDAGKSIATAIGELTPEKHRHAGLPLPIGHALRIAEEASPSNDGFAALVRLNVAISRWLVSTMSAELLRQGAETKPPDIRLGQLLSKPVTEGGWVQLVRALYDAIRVVSPDKLVLPGYIAMLGADRAKPLRELEEFITVRNRVMHGGEARAPGLFNDWLPRLRDLATRSLATLSKLPVKYVARVEHLDDDVFDVHLKDLTGDNLVTGTKIERMSRTMTEGRIIVMDRDRHLSLSPFAVYMRCPVCDSSEVFFLEQLSDAGPSYKSIREGGHGVPRLADSPDVDPRHARMLDAAARRALTIL